MDSPLTVPPDAGVRSFLNAPIHTNLATLDADIAVVGALYGVPYPPSGIETACSSAPSAIRAASARYGFDSMIDHYDFDHGNDLLNGGALLICDCGDVYADQNDIGANVERIRSTVVAILERGALPIVLGGDDSIPIPVFRAYEGHGPITIVQVDAHIDWRDDVHDVTEGYSSTMRRASEMPWVESIVQIGIRGVGSARRGEVDDATEWGATIVTADAIHQNGIGSALESIPDDRPVFITIDCDALDPSIMPAVGAPSPGGLTYHEARSLIQGICRDREIAGIDLVELTPHRDVNGISALTACRLLTAAIGTLAMR
ncbi:MAG: agmatinase [Chloroflexota bacterium]